MTDQNSTAEAIIHFPRGLKQPEGSFRFSMDALLLAGYANPGKNNRLLDLGCGCGVIALAALLSHKHLHAVGIDIAPELIDCARQNASLLGLEDRFKAYTLDLRELGASETPIRPEQFDLVTANPPFRKANQGRKPLGNMRRNALFEFAGTLPDFVKAAGFALRNKGSFYCIWSSERLAELICSLKAYRLEPKQILPVQARPGKECGLVLVKAIKNGGTGLKLDPPLLVYEQKSELPDSEPMLTMEVLKFCPWLACNSKR